MESSYLTAEVFKEILQQSGSSDGHELADAYLVWPPCEPICHTLNTFCLCNTFKAHRLNIQISQPRLRHHTLTRAVPLPDVEF